MFPCRRFSPLPLNRRSFLRQAGCGFGAVALAALLAERQLNSAEKTSNDPLAPKPPHMPDHAKAKAFIFLYMAGGPSHLETFDPKPLLNELDGQKRPAEFGDVKYQNVNTNSRILGCKRTFKKFGKSGIEVSDLFPHQSEIVDDLCLIRSMHGDMVVHSAAQYQMMTGRVIPGFPAMGSWVVYGGPGGVQIVSSDGRATLDGFRDGVTGHGPDTVALVDGVNITASARDAVRLVTDGFEIRNTNARGSGRVGVGQCAAPPCLRDHVLPPHLREAEEETLLGSEPVEDLAILTG